MTEDPKKDEKSLTTLLNDTAKQWITWDPNPKTRDHVQRMLNTKRDHIQKLMNLKISLNKNAQQKNQSLQPEQLELSKMFGSRLEFGTAGLRAEMAPGPNGINDLTIIQTTQGLCQYLIEHYGSNCESNDERVRNLEVAKGRGVVIGFDHRARSEFGLSSEVFGLYTAWVCLEFGFKVYMFDQVVCTPLVPFTVQEKGCVAGVMITASHNPKQDNGYKLYWDNGCQIISPHDKHITRHILANLCPVKTIHDTVQVHHTLPTLPLLQKKYAASLLPDPTALYTEVTDKYLRSITKSLCRHRELNSNVLGSAKPFRACYTAMHGVGCKFVKRLFALFGFPRDSIVYVTEQVDPDPTFPTVEFPNPEEGAGALKLALQYANDPINECDIILANDPDADRLAVAIRIGSNLNKGNDGWKILNGNEIGALFAWWQLEMNKKGNINGKAGKENAKSLAMVVSTVSSKFVRLMSEAEEFKYEEVLTGFKWIGNKVVELKQQGFTTIFSYEEAIGFCLGGDDTSLVKDKDGVSAAAVFYELAAYLNSQGTNCVEKLEDLYKQYGCVISNNGYVYSPDPVVNGQIFEGLRDSGKYLDNRDLSYNGKKAKCVYVRDLKSPGFDSGNKESDFKPTLPVSSGNNMLTFRFDNGVELTLRMSGTEPKLKFYAEITDKYENRESAKRELDAFVEQVVKAKLLQRS